MSDAVIDGFRFSLWPGGSKFLIVESDRLSKCVAYCKEKQIRWLEVSPHSYYMNDLDFLRDCGQVVGIFMMGGFPDMSGLYSLPRLTYLGVRCRHDIEFSRIPTLGHLETNWTPLIDEGLFTCKSLVRLSLQGYKPKSHDLSRVKELRNLESLAIIQSPITSATGVEAIPGLKELCLAYCPKLVDLRPFVEMSNTLEQLELDHCKRISDLADLKVLTHLRKLMLSDCGSVASLSFINGMPHMEFLSFVGTTVVDGDMSPLFGLKYAGFLKKRHYSHTPEEVDRIIKEQTHGQDYPWAPPPGDVLPMLVPKRQ